MRWLVLVPFLSLGCAAILGVDEYQRAVDGGPDGASKATDGAVPRAIEGCGSVEVRGSACQECMRDACCDEARACAVDEVCRLLQNCLAGCDPADTQCIGSCSRSIPYVDHALLWLDHCTAANCSDACKPPCAKYSGRAIADCMHAQGEACEDERALFATVAGVDYVECHVPCGLSLNDLNLDACGCNAAFSDVHEAHPTYGDAYGACASTPAQPDWDCVGKVVWPSVANEGAIETRVVLIGWADFTTPLRDVLVRACAAQDCDGESTPSALTDSTGTATLTLVAPITNSKDYVQYFLTTGEAIPTTLHYFYPPIRQSSQETHIAPTLAAANRAFAYADISLDPDRGEIGLAVFDCSGRPAAGVTVSNDADGNTFYFRGGLLDTTATATDAQGFVNIANLRPGVVTLTLENASAQTIARVRMLVQAGAWTITTIPPTPLP